MPHVPVGLDSAIHFAFAAARPELLVLGVALLMAGGLVGLLAGLFGVGGGTLVVPVLYETFGFFNVPDDTRMPLCIGTSLAVIIPTSLSSFRAHQKRGSVDMAVLRTWFMPIIVGVLVGTVVARFAPPEVFKLVFIIIALITASRLVFSERLSCLAFDMPRGIPMIGYGLTIGASSSLMGIGGGLVGNMILTLYGRAIHQAIATSSGMGVLVSLPGALGYVLAGWDKGGLPPFSLGFVSVIGLALLMPASLLTAKLGAALAHQLPKKPLELGLALYLLLVSVRFAATLVG